MDEILGNAARLAQGNDPRSALPLLRDILIRAPDNADALTLCGLVAQRTGRVGDAVAAFTAAREADPGNPSRIANLGLALKNARRFDEAVALLREAAAMRPDDGGVLANLGACLITADQPGEALRVLGKAVALAPGMAGPLNNLGIARARTGDRTAAVAAYESALAIRPDYHEARLNLADNLRALARREDAARHVQTVLDAMPGHPRAANLLGMLREESGDADAAIMLWQESLSRAGPTHPVGVNLMRLLIAQGRADEVPAVADALLDAVPQSTTPLAYLAAALDRMGDVKRLSQLRDTTRSMRIIDVEAPAPYATLDEFNAALRRELAEHPSLTFEPAGLVTRKGRQSGDLATAKTPALAAMTGLAKAALGEFWTDLGAMGGNGRFLDARPDNWSISLWGTILRPGGAVDPHIHAPNWLSGVYYPGFTRVGDDPQEGAFAIGALPDALGGGGSMEIVQPRSGRMILFPSFMWHGTLPFGGEDERISLAFDLVPDGIGRPHRLRPA